MHNLSTKQRFTPKRSLGQNFLIAPKVAEKIASLATSEANWKFEIRNSKLNTTVLEVGPGKGMLTRELLKRAHQVIAIEKDDNLYALLQKTFSQDIKNKRLVLLHGDAVKWLQTVNSKPQTARASKEEEQKRSLQFTVYRLPASYTVAANIPYNLTGELLRLFLEADPKPTSVTVLVQKEVAERVVASPPAGGGKESVLSLSVKAYGEPHFEGKVPRTLFRPVPGVDSAILHIANVNNAFFEELSKSHFDSGWTAHGSRIPVRDDIRETERQFFALLKLGFAHKRKFLLSNLALHYQKEPLQIAFQKNSVPENIRAENLSLNQWAELFKTLNYN